MSSEKYIPPYKVSEEAVNLIAEISAAVERFDIEISGVKGVRLRKTNRIKTMMPYLYASRSGRLQVNHRSRCAKLRGCEISLCIPLTFRRRHDKLLSSSFDDERF